VSADLDLKRYVDRILRCREIEDAAKDDTKAVYAEAKADNFDKTAIGSLVAELRKQEKSPDKFREKNDTLDAYRVAYERASHAHTREASKVSNPDPHLQRLTTGSPNPSSDDAGAKGDGSPIAGQGGTHAGSIVGQSEHQDASAAQDRNEPISASGATVTPSPLADPSPAEKAPEPPPQTHGSGAVIPDEAVPAFLLKDHPAPNERCENPKGCFFAFSREKATCAKCTGWMAKRKTRESEAA
jgi:uncharacterized protein (UPF0335 family)